MLCLILSIEVLGMSITVGSNIQFLDIDCLIISDFSNNFEIDAPCEADTVCSFYIKLNFVDGVFVVPHEYLIKIGKLLLLLKTPKIYQ